MGAGLPGRRRRGICGVIAPRRIPLGRFLGWWAQCQCPLAFLVEDPLVVAAVPPLSTAMLSYTAGLLARRFRKP
nr:MAG: hypothetical protein DIU55_13095 [Bacillota bacterium]